MNRQVIDRQMKQNSTEKSLSEQQETYNQIIRQTKLTRIKTSKYRKDDHIIYIRANSASLGPTRQSLRCTTAGGFRARVPGLRCGSSSLYDGMSSSDLLTAGACPTPPVGATL